MIGCENDSNFIVVFMVMLILRIRITLVFISILLLFYKRFSEKKPRVSRLENVKNRKDFEVFVYGLLPTKWYTHVILNGKSNDWGIDVFWKKWGKLRGFQCKFYKGSIGSPVVRNLVGSGKLYGCDVVCLCYTGRLTKESKKQAKSLWVRLRKF